MKSLIFNSILSAALALGLLGLVSCGAGNDPIPGEETAQSLSQVRFDIRLTVGQQPDSRSTGRQLDSADGAQSVTNMRLYLFRAPMAADPEDNSAFRYCRFPEEGSGRLMPYLYVPVFEKDSVWTDKADETHALLVDPCLAKGYRYKILAIGRDDITETDESTGLLFPSTIEGDEGWVDVTADPEGATTLSEVAMSANLRSLRLQTSELFTGCTEAFLVDDDHEDFTATIILSRSVTGMLMYIENIPTHFKALADFTRPGIMPPYRPITLITKGKEYRVSSVAIAPISITSKVALISREACGATAVNETFRGYFADTNLTGAEERDGYFVNTNPTNQAHPNSILSGSFILPISTPQPLRIIDGCEPMDHTLYLVFYTTDNDIDDHTFATPFFWYPIECISQTYDEAKGEYVDAPGSSPSSTYPLRANQIYSLGEKYGSVDTPLDLSALSGPSDGPAPGYSPGSSSIRTLIPGGTQPYSCPLPLRHHP